MWPFWGPVLGLFGALGGALWALFRALRDPILRILAPPGPDPKKVKKRPRKRLAKMSHFGLIFGLMFGMFFRPRFWRPFGQDFG